MEYIIHAPPHFCCLVSFLSHFGESWNQCSVVGVRINQLLRVHNYYLLTNATVDDESDTPHFVPRCAHRNHAVTSTIGFRLVFRPRSAVQVAAVRMSEMIMEERGRIQEYLRIKGINEIMVSMLQQICVERPDNPQQYVVDFMLRRYPESIAVPSTAASTPTDAEETSLAGRERMQQRQRQQQQQQQQLVACPNSFGSSGGLFSQGNLE